MEVIIKYPYEIRFHDATLYALYDYACKNSQLFAGIEGVYVENVVESFFNIKLDYDEDTREYIIYFKTSRARLFFEMKYSECLKSR